MNQKESYKVVKCILSKNIKDTIRYYCFQKSIVHDAMTKLIFNFNEYYDRLMKEENDINFNAKYT